MINTKMEKRINITGKNEKGNEIVFNKVTKNSRKIYQEVLAEVSSVGSRTVQASLPILGDTFTVEKIRKMAPNGLFTTLIDKNSLSKFKDGTFIWYKIPDLRKLQLGVV